MWLCRKNSNKGYSSFAKCCFKCFINTTSLKNRNRYKLFVVWNHNSPCLVQRYFTYFVKVSIIYHKLNKKDEKLVNALKKTFQVTLFIIY